MHPKFSLLLLSLLGAASSAPTVEIAERSPVAELEKRTVGGIYLCTDINFSGTCGYKVQPLNTCIVLTSPYDLSISSFGPDKGTKCHLYSTHDCTTYGCSSPGCGFAPDIILSYPGSADLRNQNFNDHARSFDCVAT